jgi:hypothetical protein
MTQASHMHPRKLYTSLCECADARERAASGLAFMRGACGAEEGFLLLWRGGELVLAASSSGRELPNAIMDKAREQWDWESDTQRECDATLTIDASKLIAAPETPRWEGVQGERYEPRFLGIYRDSTWMPVGMAVLRIAQAGPLHPIRRAYIDAICNAFLDSDDVSS